MSGNSFGPSACEPAPTTPVTSAREHPVPPASVWEAAEEQEEPELDDADEKAAVLQALVESAPDLVIQSIAKVEFGSSTGWPRVSTSRT